MTEWFEHLLEAADEASAQAALHEYVADGQWINTADVATQPGLPIMLTPPVFDGDGNVVTPPVYASTWHMNLYLRTKRVEYPAGVTLHRAPQQQRWRCAGTTLANGG